MALHHKVKAKVNQRPAETASFTVALGIIVGILTDGVEVSQDNLVIVITAIVGALPAVVTYIAELKNRLSNLEEDVT